MSSRDDFKGSRILFGIDPHSRHKGLIGEGIILLLVLGIGITSWKNNDSRFEHRNVIIEEARLCTDDCVIHERQQISLRGFVSLI